jgi:hypothetical protein
MGKLTASLALFSVLVLGIGGVALGQSAPENQLMHERVMHAPIYDPATLHGVGPRVEEPAVGLNPLLYFAAPYEDMKLKRP